LKGGEIMNAAVVLLQQNDNASFLRSANHSTQGNNIFRGMLLNRQLDQQNNEKQLSDLPLEDLRQIYSTLLDYDGNFEDLISNLLKVTEDEPLTLLIDDLVKDDNGQELHIIMEKLSNMIESKKTFDMSQLLTDQFQLNFSSNSMDIGYRKNLSKETIQSDFFQVLTQVELLLEDISFDQNLTKVASKILKLLEKWFTLENKESSQLLLMEDAKINPIWKELLDAYQKRSHLFTKQQYQSEANVTNKDIIHWLKDAIARQFDSKNNTQIQPVNLTNTPMSTIEQYYIYIQQLENSQSIDRQLLEQFKQVIKTSQFFTRDGVNQLALTLRPEKLGEMLVRFIEKNGEMTLKIIVSSQTTKQVLETNIRELRNIFSPHQISIEEQEIDFQNIHKQSEGKSLEEDQQEQSQHSNPDEEDQLENDGESNFYELLNEEV